MVCRCGKVMEVKNNSINIFFDACSIQLYEETDIFAKKEHDNIE